MVDREPRSISPEDLGIEVPTTQAPTNLNRPIVARNPKGHINWRLPGYTPEQNEELGTRNFQALFLDRFPEFESSFPREPDGKIRGDIKVAASQFISKAVMDKGFRQLTTSATSRVSAPYFDGSYAKAVQKSFLPWGVEVVLRTAGKRFRLIPIESAIATDRRVTFSALKRRHGLDFKTLANYLQGLESREVKGLNGHTVVSYNEVEAQAALSAVNSRPKVDSKEGKYTDQQGRAWVTLRNLSDRAGISNDTHVKELLLDIPTINGRASTGVRTTLYDEVLALQALSGILALPKVDRTGRYIDQDGRSWVAISALATIFSVSETSLRRLISEMPQVEGRVKGRRCTLCAEIETKAYLAQKIGVTQSIKTSPGTEFTLLPRVPKETSMYTDPNNETWVPAVVFLRRFGVSKATVTEERLKNVDFIEGRGVTNRPTKLYNTRQLLQTFSSFIDRPVVDKETDEYTDKKGTTWVSQRYICNQYGIGDPTLKPYLANIASLIARGVSGRLVTLYPKKEIARQLEHFTNSHRVDRHTKIYVDEKGDSWATATYFQSKYGLSRDGVKARFDGVTTLPGRDATNKKVTLYRVDEGEAALNDIRSLPRQDEGNRFIDDNKQSWVTARFLETTYHIQRKILEMIRGKVARITGRDSIGNIREFFNEEEVIKVLRSQGYSICREGGLDESALAEYRESLIKGQIMSFEDFMDKRGRK